MHPSTIKVLSSRSTARFSKLLNHVHAQKRLMEMNKAKQPCTEAFSPIPGCNEGAFCKV